MAKKSGRPNRAKPSQIYAIISITMVLFVLGILGALFINASNLSKQLRENVEISLFLKDDASKEEIKKLQSSLDKKKYIVYSDYVSKEKAAEEFEKEYGEEFTELLGFNPLSNTINVHLESSYTHQDSLNNLEYQFLQNKAVNEVYYHKSIINLINDNMRKLSIALLVLGAILLFIAISLIDNTIKLSMYSNRFLIKSMQLVGATRKFITRPFVNRSVINGLVSGFLACILLFGLLYFLERNLNIVHIQRDIMHYAYISFSIILIGVLLSYWSTKAAVLKYLKMKLDELY